MEPRRHKKTQPGESDLMKSSQERLLYCWHTVQSDGRPESRACPVIGRPVGECTQEEPALVGEVVFQKTPKDTRWRWLVGGVIILFLAASWLTSLILPFSFIEVMEVVKVFTLCAVIVILCTVVVAAFALWAINAAVPCILKDVNLSQ